MEGVGDMTTKTNDDDGGGLGCMFVVAVTLLGFGAGLIWGAPVGLLVAGGSLMAVVIPCMLLITYAVLSKRGRGG